MLIFLSACVLLVFYSFKRDIEPLQIISVTVLVFGLMIATLAPFKETEHAFKTLSSSVDDNGFAKVIILEGVDEPFVTRDAILVNQEIYVVKVIERNYWGWELSYKFKGKINHDQGEEK